MISELEAAAADSVGGFFRRKPVHALPIGTPCPNCATPLEGPWCHACGQKGEEYHRSIGHLIAEAVEGLTHFDGRVWQTLPQLVRDPAGLTRSYLDGHRAPQIPPFRLFLIVVLLVFFTGGLGATSSNTHTNVVVPSYGEKTVAVPGANFTIKPSTDPKAKPNTAFGRWMISHAQAAGNHPEKFTESMEAWGHRLAILALPLAALMLGLLFLGRRKLYLFDHLIFSMHSLSFQGLLLSVSFLLGKLVGDWSQLLWLAAPVHLFFHMRGVYQTSVAGALARMAALLVGSFLGAMVIMSILVLLGLNAAGAA
jgi:hypothetical protein